MIVFSFNICSLPHTLNYNKISESVDNKCPHRISILTFLNFNLKQVHGLAVNKDSEKTASENGTGDKTLFKIPFKLSKKSRDDEQNAKEPGEIGRASCRERV